MPDPQSSQCSDGAKSALCNLGCRTGGPRRGNITCVFALILLVSVLLRSDPVFADQQHQACAATSSDNSDGASPNGKPLECTDGSAASPEVVGEAVDAGFGKDNEDDDDEARGARRTWRWIPEAEHRCNITVVTASEAKRRFGSEGLPPLYPQPLVIKDDSESRRRNVKFAEMTTLDNIASSLPPKFNVTLSSSNSFSARRRHIPLTQYLNETVTAAETYPDALSNETWYLFGETYGPEWEDLLQNFDLPSCHTCTRDLSALAFGVGNRGSGVQWHTHGPGFSESVHGRKHWIMYPPDRRPEYDPDYASRHWMERTYASLAEGVKAGTVSEDELPHECTLWPGDMVYFPDRWHHATINLDPYTVFVSTFTTEHF